MRPFDASTGSTSNELRPPGRKAWVDVAKGLAIFLVVWYHSSLYLASTGMQGIPWILKVPLELFPMPAFFVIAGMLAARSVRFTFGDLWRRRVLPMLYLYVVWSAIRFAFYAIVPGIDGGLGDLPADSPLTLALIFIWPSSSYWFLYALAIFTVAAWLLRAVPPWVQLSLAVTLSAIVTSGILDTHNVGWNRVLGLFVFYLVGIHFAKAIPDAVVRATPWRLVAILAVAAGIVAAMILLDARGLPGIVLLGQVLFVAAGFAFAQLLVPWRAASFLSTWGASSLHIYLLHLYVIVPIAALFALLDWTPPRLLGFGIQIAVAVVAVAASLVLMRWTGRARWLYIPPRLRRRSSSRHSNPTRSQR